MIRTHKLTILALGMAGFACLSGCSSEGNIDKQAASNGASGQVDLALGLANGTTLQSASYVVTGPAGFSKSGSIDVSHSSQISGLVGGIPAGNGYTITISATSTDGSTSCGGSATFSVTAHQTTPVTVSVDCREAARNGSVLVNGSINVCPTIDGISSSPAEAKVGSSVALSAAAHDSDAGPSALAYTWTAPSGSFSSANGAATSFTCDTAGPVTVTLKVSDGDPAATCADTQTTTITCSAVGAAAGTYVAGDFHNHTTCSDGAISMQKLVKKATDKTDTPWGLDWFVQAGHGGNGYRNCTLVEDASLATPAFPTVADPNTPWTVSGVTPKGDVTTTTTASTDPFPGTFPNMWRWESIQEFQYPLIEYLNAYKNLPLFLGIETVTPGHEHTSMSVITGQIPTTIDPATLPSAPPYVAAGNANGLAKYEYCFDRSDTDTSRGTSSNNFDCSVTGSANDTDPNWNATGHKLTQPSGSQHGVVGHQKTLEGLKWMKQNHENTSYFVPAHLERAGQFNPAGDNGFNVEDLRDFNNTAPKTAFGFETQPGHGASANRGEYQVLRNTINGVKTDSVGGTTFGGTGVYGGIVGGVWDALLGEGRNFWFFASSDWHNRGSFNPDDRRSTQDFYPGEYQRNYTMVQSNGQKPTPQQIVDGLRSGNNFGTQGQLIDRLAFVACSGTSPAIVSELAANAATTDQSVSRANCATMGQKLVVASGTDIVVGIAVRDPEGTNYSPYTFPNPSLAQVNVSVPLNKPVLDHIDLIGGAVTGYRTKGAANYAGAWPANTDWLKADGTTTGLGSVPDAAKNTSTAVLKTFSKNGSTPWTKVSSPVDGSSFYVMTFTIPAASASQYVRVRGTNMPAAVPFETDASGNPLSDVYTNANDTTRLTIPCTVAHSASSQFDGCPDHLAIATGASPITGQRAVSFDVAAWSDLWFYANPIYVEVNGSTPVAGVQ